MGPAEIHWRRSRGGRERQESEAQAEESCHKVMRLREAREEKSVDVIFPTALPSVFPDAPWRCLNVCLLSWVTC